MELILFGQVHPLNGGWTVPKRQELVWNQHSVLVEVTSSRVVAVVQGEEPDHLMTFINDVRAAIGTVVDGLGFGLGIPLRVEVTHGLKDGDELLNLWPGWPELVVLEGREVPSGSLPKEELAPIVLASTGSVAVRHALADVQRAIEFFDDTGFYCYRAMESLRSLFLVDESDRGRGRARSWDGLREFLSIDRADLDFIKQFADERRHGGHSNMTEDDRRRCLLLTRMALRQCAGALANQFSEDNEA